MTLTYAQLSSRQLLQAELGTQRSGGCFGVPQPSTGPANGGVNDYALWGFGREKRRQRLCKLLAFCIIVIAL